MILLITNRRDITTDFVVAALRERSADFIRLNTEDLLHEWQISWTLDGWVATDMDGRRVNSRDVHAVYYRRPRDPQPLDGTAGDAGGFVVRESRSFLQGIYATTEAPWISSPAAILAAEDKFTQLTLAKRIGLCVPNTLVTHDPAEARRFCANRGAIVKPLSSGFLSDDPAQLTYAEHVDARWDFADVALCPHLFQERVRKSADLRVTVVDEQVFACRISSQDHAATQLDWRRATALRISLAHKMIELDQITRDACVELVRALGLRFGAIDLVERVDGGYTFLEINPNGQWAWIEQRTGTPISHAIARALHQPLRVGGSMCRA